MRTLKTSNHIVFDCHYHIVWCTKYRLQLLQSPVSEDLLAIINQVAQEHDATVEGVEIMPDHVHVVVGCYPHGVHKIVRAMKGRSSRVLREKYPAINSRTPSLWTRSYFIATTGGVSLDVVKKYVESQKRRVS